MLELKELDLRPQDEMNNWVHAIVLCLGECEQGVMLRHMLADGRPIDPEGILSDGELRLNKAVVFSNADKVDLYFDKLFKSKEEEINGMNAHINAHLEDQTHSHALLLVISSTPISVGNSTCSGGDAPAAKLRKYLEQMKE